MIKTKGLGKEELFLKDEFIKIEQSKEVRNAVVGLLNKYKVVQEIYADMVPHWGETLMK